MTPNAWCDRSHGHRGRGGGGLPLTSDPGQDHPPGQDPPQAYIREPQSMGTRYASYWNTSMFGKSVCSLNRNVILSSLCQISQRYDFTLIANRKG